MLLSKSWIGEERWRTLWQDGTNRESLSCSTFSLGMTHTTPQHHFTKCRWNMPASLLTHVLMLQPSSLSCSNIVDVRFAPVLVPAAEMILDIYKSVVGQSSLVDRQLLRLQDLLEREINYQQDLLEVMGMLDTLFASSLPRKEVPCPGAGSSNGLTQGEVSASWGWLAEERTAFRLARSVLVTLKPVFQTSDIQQQNLSSPNLLIQLLTQQCSHSGVWDGDWEGERELFETL